MKLSTMQATIGGMLERGEEVSAAFASRFRHLNQMCFPPMPAVGRGSRFDYGADELIACALVFELGESFVPPGIAVRMTTSLWPEIARGVSRLLSDGDERDVIAIAPRGLADLGGSRSSDQGRFEISFVARDERGHPLLTGFADRRGMIALNLSLFCDALAERLSSVDPAWSRARLADELRASLEGVAAGQGEVGVRLGERDYYWTRAVELLGDDAVRAAVGTGEDLHASGTLADLASYLLDPLPREAGKAREPVPTIGGRGFADALRALLSHLRVDGSRQLDNELRVMREVGSSPEELHRRLRAFAARRLAEVGAPAPSASVATRRRKGRAGE